MKKGKREEKKTLLRIESQSSFIGSMNNWLQSTKLTLGPSHHPPAYFFLRRRVCFDLGSSWKQTTSWKQQNQQKREEVAHRFVILLVERGNELNFLHCTIATNYAHWGDFSLLRSTSTIRPERMNFGRPRRGPLFFPDFHCLSATA